MKEDASELNFGAAMQELEGILRRVESEEIDIDELAEELKRAAELLELCRGKIRRAEVEVSQVVQSLDEPEVAAKGVEPSSSPADSEAGEDAGSADDAAAGTTANLFEHDG